MKRLKILVVCYFLVSNAIAADQIQWDAIIKLADRNHDGQLSKAEIAFFPASRQFPSFKAFVAQHFRELDADGDQRLNAAELTKSAAQLRMTDADMVTSVKQEPRSRLSIGKFQ